MSDPIRTTPRTESTMTDYAYEVHGQVRPRPTAPRIARMIPTGTVVRLVTSYGPVTGTIESTRPNGGGRHVVTIETDLGNVDIDGNRWVGNGPDDIKIIKSA